jgi:hypothetical protein
MMQKLKSDMVFLWVGEWKVCVLAKRLYLPRLFTASWNSEHCRNLKKMSTPLEIDENNISTIIMDK